MSAQAAVSLPDILERFERAWRPETPPLVEDFLPKDTATPPAVLLELALTDLELRLKAGMPARADAYLARFPELGNDPAAVVELVAAEFRFRRRREPAIGAA